MLDKTFLNNPNLSWKAKGLLAYLLSLPKDWLIRISDLVNRSTDGETSVYSALRELREHRHARIVVIRKEDGKLAGRMWEIDEVGFQENDPTDTEVSPATVKPQPSKPRTTKELSSTEYPSDNEKQRFETAGKPPSLPDGGESFPSTNERLPVKEETAHARTIKLWMDQFKKQYGFEFAFDGREGKAVKELLMLGMKPEEIVSLAIEVRRLPDKFRAAQGTALSSLRINLNPLRTLVAQQDAEPK